MDNSNSRRNFLKTAALAGFGALVLPNSLFAYSNDFKTDKKVRVGFIGVGLRGQEHVKLLAKRNDVEIVAFADPEKRMLAALSKNLKRQQ